MFEVAKLFTCTVYRKEVDMKETLEITLDIDKKLWEKLKKLFCGLEDESLFHFLLQVGEYVLEAITRRSLIFEINGKTKQEESIDFHDLLEQYYFDDMIKKAKPDDFI